MSKRMLSALLLAFFISAFVPRGFAQAGRAGSSLAGASLPAGVGQVPDAEVPAEMKAALSKLVAAGGEGIRQGETEVLTWVAGAGFKKGAGDALLRQVVDGLRAAGWEYEVAERADEYLVFTLTRQQPSARAIVGFFVRTDDGLLLAQTEMLRAGQPAVAARDEADAAGLAVSPAGRGGGGGAGVGALVGKWANGRTGSSIRNAYGVTIASNASRFTYEFYADGTVGYTGIMHVTSMAGCRMETFTTKKGRVSIEGNRMVIKYAPAAFSRDDTCDSAGNYKKTLPAETETLTWSLKEVDGRTRFCIEGKDGESCFDRTN